MTKETIDNNSLNIKEQMKRFIDFSNGRAIMDNNANWLMDLNYVNFLREIGVHFRLIICFGQIPSSCAWKRPVFLEFNYMLMQAYDFWNCTGATTAPCSWAEMISGPTCWRAWSWSGKRQASPPTP